MKAHTILCVDDEPNVLRALQRLLRREGHRILTTTDGREALNIIKHETIALTLVDQKLPQLDSVRLLEQVKEISPDTIRIVVSSHTPVTKIINAINKGEVYRFITKPWEDQELRLIVKEVLERYELIQDKRNLLNTIAEQNLELQKMNEHLAQLHEERTQDLTYAQQIMAELPVPIIGLDPDGMIVFVNQVAQLLFGDIGYGFLEFSPLETLPPELVDFIDQQHQAETKEVHPLLRFAIADRNFQVEFQPLEGQAGLRGYLLTFHRSSDREESS